MLSLHPSTTSEEPALNVSSLLLHKYKSHKCKCYT
jgi:hypothetical protein